MRGSACRSRCWRVAAVRSGEFDIPVGGVEELLPRGVAIIREPHSDDGIAPRLDGGADQVDARLLGRSAALSYVTFMTRADDVFPCGGPGLGSWDDVVEAEFGRREPLPAVLARAVVAREEVASVELDFLLGQLGERQNPNDAGDDKVEADRTNPIVLAGFERPLEGAQLRPVVKIIGGVPAVLDVHDFGDGPVRIVSLEKQRERPAHTDHAQGAVVRVKQQHVAIKTGTQVDRDSRCEDDTSLPSRTP